MNKSSLAKLSFMLSFAFFIPKFQVFSQAVTTEQEDTSQPQIQLPAVTTYIPSSLETKITWTSEQIQQQNLPDLPELLKSSGIQLLSYGPYGLEQKPSIRGFTDETVRVVLNGVCVNNPQTGTFDFSTIDLSTIEKIEIVKGGFTEGTDDEGAVGGVIYITTSNQSLSHNFSADSQLSTYFNSETPLDTFSQSLAYNGPVSDNTFLSTSIKGTFANNNFRENPARVIDGVSNAQITTYFLSGNSLTLSDQTYIGNKQLPGAKYSSDQAEQQDYNNLFSISLFTPNISPFFTLKNNLYWQSTNRFYSDISETSEHFINDFKYNLSADFLTFHNLKENAGLTIEYTSLNSTNDGNINQFSGVLKETTKISLSPIFSLSFPLAAKFSGSNFAFIPKAAVSADLQFLVITLDAYRMVQFPNLDDLYWLGTNFHGNPDLQPESGYGADLSFNLQNQLIPSTITFFTAYYNNKIQWAASDGQWMPQNVSSAFYAGIDFDTQLSLYNNFFTIKASGEYLYNALLDSSNPYTYKKRIMWTPDLTASLSFNFDFEKAFLSISADYTGKRYLSNMNISFLKPYVLINATGELKSFAHLTPYFRLNNILNTKYESIENYPMPGISFTIGLKSKITYND